MKPNKLPIQGWIQYIVFLKKYIKIIFLFLKFILISTC
jgi:hypothetical protein